MFNTQTDLFMTRVTNPTDKKYVHHGLPRHPALLPGESIDIPGVYTTLKNDIELKRSIMFGIRYETFTTLLVKQVADLANLPVADASKAPVAAKVATAPVEEIPVMTELDLEKPESEMAVSKLAEKGRGVNPLIKARELSPDLPPGVSRLDDINKEIVKNMVTDSPVSRRGFEALQEMKDTMVRMGGKGPVKEVAPDSPAAAATVRTDGGRAAMEKFANDQLKAPGTKAPPGDKGSKRFFGGVKK